MNSMLQYFIIPFSPSSHKYDIGQRIDTVFFKGRGNIVFYTQHCNWIYTDCDM